MEKKSELVFGIDFDGTFAADPLFFKAFVSLLRASGHSCVMVTGREDVPGLAEPVRALVGDLMPIVFAGGTWKKDAAKAAGWIIDIWIDDNPTYIMPPQTLRETLVDLRRMKHPAIVP